MMKAPARVALVGTSGYGRRHLTSLLEWDRAGLIQLVALIDLGVPEDAVRLLRDAGASPRWFRTLDEAIAVANPDTIVVAAPPHTHYAFAKTAIEAHRSLYLEKPPVPLLSQLDELLATPTTKRVEVGFQGARGSIEMLERALQMTDAGPVERITATGALIRPDSYYTRNKWAGKWFRGGEPILDGPLFNPLAHILHAALLMAGRVHPGWRPVRVEAECVSVRDIEGDDVTAIRVLSETGPEVLALGTTAADENREPTVTIHTALGSISVREGGLEAMATFDGHSRHLPLEAIRSTALLRHVSDPEGRPDPLISLAAARNFTLVVNAAVEAVGRPTSVSDASVIEAHDGEPATRLPGIASAIVDGARRGLTFSELGQPWATEQHSIDVTDYRGLTASAPTSSKADRESAEL